MIEFTEKEQTMLLNQKKMLDTTYNNRNVKPQYFALNTGKDYKNESM